jgi:flagellar assembly protein FliH
MILRDAIFSADRRHLGAQAAPAVHAASPETAPALFAAEVLETGATYEARHTDVQLSSDRVASWLVTQDGATRTALAAMLSEELAAVRDAARDDGYARGHSESMKEVRDKVGGAMAALAALHESAEAAFDATAAQLNDACADIVAEVFFKLAGTALVTREAIVGVVGEVLKRVREERELRIHVNPNDLPVLRSAEAGIAASLPGRRFTLVADGRVEAGGCIVESTLGSLDGRLEVQLAELCASLRAAKEAGSSA